MYRNGRSFRRCFWAQYCIRNKNFENGGRGGGGEIPKGAKSLGISPGGGPNPRGGTKSLRHRNLVFKVPKYGYLKYAQIWLKFGFIFSARSLVQLINKFILLSLKKMKIIKTMNLNFGPAVKVDDASTHCVRILLPVIITWPAVEYGGSEVTCVKPTFFLSFRGCFRNLFFISRLFSRFFSQRFSWLFLQHFSRFFRDFFHAFSRLFSQLFSQPFSRFLLRLFSRFFRDFYCDMF